MINMTDTDELQHLAALRERYAGVLQAIDSGPEDAPVRAYAEARLSCGRLKHV